MRRRLYVRLAAFAILLTAGVFGIAEAQKIYNGKRTEVADAGDDPAGAAKNANSGNSGNDVQSGNGSADRAGMGTGNPSESQQPRQPNPIPNHEGTSSAPPQPPSAYGSNFSGLSGVRTASTFGAPRAIEDEESPALGKSSVESDQGTDTNPLSGDSSYQDRSNSQDGISAAATDSADSSSGAHQPGARGGTENSATSHPGMTLTDEPIKPSPQSFNDNSAPPLMPYSTDGAPARGTNTGSRFATSDEPGKPEPREFVEPEQAAPATTLGDTNPATQSGATRDASAADGSPASDSNSAASPRYRNRLSPTDEVSTNDDARLATDPSATGDTDSGSTDMGKTGSRDNDSRDNDSRDIDSRDGDSRGGDSRGGDSRGGDSRGGYSSHGGGRDVLANELPRAPAATLPGRQSVAAAPGPPELEGVQTPSMSIEKTAPSEVQVGREATFQILVRNVGQVVANDVIVTDRVPQGARLVGTTPQATTTGGLLVWQLGAMQPGADAELSFTVVPEVEGELGSVAQVTFAAHASARTVSTRPVVRLEVETVPQVLIGESLAVVIVVRNDGTGPARGVVIEEDVPPGLSHPAGRQLENTLGTLGPGESRRIELALTAEQAGTLTNTVRVRDDGDLEIVKNSSIEVTAPRLGIDVSGPTLRYLERQATYEIAVQNPGTAVAKNIELISFLPRGMKFVSATKLGQYSPQRHAVLWNLEELPPTKSGIVQLVALPVEEGEQKLRIESRGEGNISAAKEHAVRVESVAELLFTISDSADPIEVGADTTYTIEVTNNGTKSDANIVLAASVPDELEPIDAEGPTKGAIQGKRVEFAPVPQLAPRETILFRIQARGARAGDSRLLVQLRSDQAGKPVSKEESTKVYAD